MKTCGCLQPCNCSYAGTPRAIQLNLVDFISFVRGTGGSGCEEVLRKLKNAIGVTDEKGNFRFADGSQSRPILTPDFNQSETPARIIMVQDEAGQWYGLIPSNEEILKGKLQLVYEAGVSYWESIGANKLRYNRVDLKDAACGFNLAGWQECEGGKGSDLVRIPISKLYDLIWDTETMPEAETEDCMEGLVVVQGGKMRLLKPAADQQLVSRKNDNGVICWVLENLAKVAAGSNKMIFKYTGAVASFTVPEGKTSMELKLWGADSGEDDWPGQTISRFGGGFTKLVMPVAAGATYMVMVGQRGFRHGPAHGFGGIGRATPYVNASAGGGTFVCSGSGPILATDAARAVGVAGGAAGCGSITSHHYNTGSNGGNSSTGGGEGTFQGASAAAAGDGNGAGGGGYAGGGLNKGGTGFAHATAISSTITAGAADAKAGTSDPDYIPDNGNGLAVVTFS